MNHSYSGRRLLSFGAWVAAIAVVGCGADERVDPKETDDITDVELPDPGPLGFQLRTPLRSVAQGEEVQDCYFFEVPFDEDVFVDRVTLAQTTGSHHMNVFRVRTVHALDGAPGDIVRGGECWKAPNWADWPLVTNSQRAGVEDWELPDGVAIRLGARERLMVQSHYVNATTQKTPGNAEVIVNFHGAEAASVKDELGTLFATNQEIRICPGDTNRTFEASCKGLAQHAPVTIAAASGHFHSRGKRFTINEWDPVTSTGAQFYESSAWDDPPFARGLDVKIPQGAGVSWSCEFSVGKDQCGDAMDDCCFTFGGKVEFQEHCNAFVYYYPRSETDINCF